MSKRETEIEIKSKSAREQERWSERSACEASERAQESKRDGVSVARGGEMYVGVKVLCDQPSHTAVKAHTADQFSAAAISSTRSRGSSHGATNSVTTTKSLPPSGVSGALCCTFG